MQIASFGFCSSANYNILLPVNGSVGQICKNWKPKSWLKNINGYWPPSFRLEYFKLKNKKMTENGLHKSFPFIMFRNRKIIFMIISSWKKIINSSNSSNSLFPVRSNNASELFLALQFTYQKPRSSTTYLLLMLYSWAALLSDLEARAAFCKHVRSPELPCKIEVQPANIQYSSPPCSFIALHT